MFVDKVQVELSAGDGGNGVVSFRQEKFIDKGGPDGGDGGKGGDIVVQASRNQNTLANFRYQKEIVAPAGKDGSKRNRHGKSAANLVVKLPVGTVISNTEGEVLADLTEDGQEVVIAKGGRGGFGNAHFTSSTRQAPRVAEKGEQGEAFSAIFELKMIADIGLVGLPNAGKSTLLSVISNARPEIANYPFTTLTPNLGVVDIDESTSVLVADIPGLIEGAAAGKGLGDEFLRHVERTKVLVHLIDAYQDDLPKAYNTIQAELSAYKVDLSTRPQIVVINKVDGLDQELIDMLVAELKPLLPPKTALLAISAQSGTGVKELLHSIKKVLARQKLKEEPQEEVDKIPVLTLPATEDHWKVTRQDNVFEVSGKKIERFASQTDFGNPHGERRLRDIMRKMGIMHELVRQKIEAGQKIKFRGTNGTIEY